MKPIFLLLSIFLFSISAHSYQVRFGPGVLTKANSISDVKFLSFSKEWSVRQNVFSKMEVGYWSDKRHRLGLESLQIF